MMPMTHNDPKMVIFEVAVDLAVNAVNGIMTTKT